jgi:SAM-dependent methyltransferase
VSLRRVERTWRKLGHEDPLWAILSDPAKKGGGWDEADFFQSGAAEIREVLTRATAVRPGLARRRALDFGCGVGRLTLPLARHFERVDGVDISEPMIARAREYARAVPQCQFYLNARPDLHLFPSGRYDFVYSTLTLQHMKPRYSRRYLGEFVRVLDPGGVLVFHLPTQTSPGGRWYRRAVPRSIRQWAIVHLRRETLPEMHGVPESEVRRTIEAAGGQLHRADPRAGDTLESWLYTVTK